jgi:hypothetical protein
MRTKNKKSFIYKNKIFETQPVKTDPYVWHLTLKCNRLNIALEGILPIYGLSFANNINDDICGMWHWNRDFGIKAYSGLDFWRIDVRKAGVRWYIDKNLVNESARWGEYVCTPSPIPVSAITLFEHYDASEFKISQFQKSYSEKNEFICEYTAREFIKSKYEKIYINEMEGAANCATWNLPLKKVGARELLLNGLALDNANKNMLWNVLPKLFEEQPEQTLAALCSKKFESFYELLFKNRKTIGTETEWRSMFDALIVEDKYMRRTFRASLDSHTVIGESVANILITMPYDNFQDYRFFLGEEWRCSNIEYIRGTYHERPKLKYCPFGIEALNQFLMENPKII